MNKLQKLTFIKYNIILFTYCWTVTQ